MKRICRESLNTSEAYKIICQKSAVARQNSGGAAGESTEALFCLDFSLVRFFSSRKRNEHSSNFEYQSSFIKESKPSIKLFLTNRQLFKGMLFGLDIHKSLQLTDTKRTKDLPEFIRKVFYGVFHQALFIAILFLSVSKSMAFAQSDTTIVMSEIVISDNRITFPFSEASRTIEVITAKEIRRNPIQSIPEILLYSPGVDIRQRGPMGVQSDIGIRGGSFEQTLILLNGMKLTDPQTGHHIMNIPIPLDQIERIEILKGPGARIFGQNAFAGAVNFITRVSDEKKVGIRMYGGSFGSYGGNISLSLPLGNYRQTIAITRDASDGYRHNTDYGINNFFYQSELPMKAGKLGFQYGYTDRKFGANGFYASPAFTEQYEEVKTSIGSVSYEYSNDKFRIQPRVYWRWNNDNYLFVRDNPGAYQNLTTTNTAGAEVNMSYISNIGTTGFGFEYRKELIAAEWVRGGNQTNSVLDGKYRNNIGVFLDHKFRIGRRFDVTPGIYTNWYSDFSWNAFPGIDVGYKLTEKVRLYANAGSSYRIPTFYDQYYSSPVEQGNPDLMPEEALTYEVGFRYMDSKGFSVESNYFNRDASNLIDWVYDTTDSIWTSQNIQSVLTNGVEISLQTDFQKWIDKDFFLNKVRLSYQFLDQQYDQDESIQSRYVLENLRHQFIGSLDHRLFWKIKNSFRARYVDRVEQGPYWLFDDRIYYEAKNLSVFVEASNLTDQQYTEVMTPMPGRWIRSGVLFNVALGQ